MIEIFVPATGAGPLAGFSNKEIGACIRFAINFSKKRNLTRPCRSSKKVSGNNADHAGIRVRDGHIFLDIGFDHWTVAVGSPSLVGNRIENAVIV